MLATPPGKDMTRSRARSPPSTHQGPMFISQAGRSLISGASSPPHVESGRKLHGPTARLFVRLFVRDWQRPGDAAVRARIGMVAALLALVVNSVLFLLKLAAGLLLDSLALIADALDSLGDMLIGVVALVALRVALKGPDREHPYGHQRAEEIAAIAVATVITLLGVQFLVEAGRRAISPEEETAFENYALFVVAVGVIGKLAIARLSIQIGGYIESGMIKGSGWNYFLDVLATLAAGAALLGRRQGIYWLDPVLAGVIALLIVRMGVKTFREASDQLIGRGGSPKHLDEIHRVACDTPGVLGCSDIEVHWYGRQRRLSMHVQVADSVTLREGHEIAKRVQERLVGLHADWLPVVSVDPVSQK